MPAKPTSTTTNSSNWLQSPRHVGGQGVPVSDMHRATFVRGVLFGTVPLADRQDPQTQHRHSGGGAVTKRPIRRRWTRTLAIGATPPNTYSRLRK
jgi:hypothetical protein